MTQIKQFRYYGDRSQKNYPKDLTYSELHSGNIFRQCGLVTQLGVQAQPGTIFYLNESIFPICVGFTGIYELDLSHLSHISAIRFDQESLLKLNDESDGIIIDVVYEGTGVN